MGKKNRIYQEEVIEQIVDILKNNNIRYKLESSLPNKLRMDIYLIDANICIECKGNLTKHKKRHTIGNTKHQIQCYKKYIKDVWLIYPTKRNVGKNKDNCDVTFSVSEFGNYLPYIKKKISEY